MAKKGIGLKIAGWLFGILLILIGLFVVFSGSFGFRGAGSYLFFINIAIAFTLLPPINKLIFRKLADKGILILVKIVLFIALFPILSPVYESITFNLANNAQEKLEAPIKEWMAGLEKADNSYFNDFAGKYYHFEEIPQSSDYVIYFKSKDTVTITDFSDYDDTPSMENVNLKLYKEKNGDKYYLLEGIDNLAWMKACQIEKRNNGFRLSIVKISPAIAKGNNDFGVNTKEAIYTITQASYIDTLKRNYVGYHKTYLAKQEKNDKEISELLSSRNESENKTETKTDNSTVVNGTVKTSIVLDGYDTKSTAATEVLQALYNSAKNNPSASRIELTVFFDQKGMTDRYGNELSGNLEMGKITEEDLSEIRKFKDAYSLYSDTTYKAAYSTLFMAGSYLKYTDYLWSE